MTHISDSRFPVDGDPRPVIRGSNLHTGFLGIDSLYIVLEYPALDIFHHYAQAVTTFNDAKLYTGIPFDDFLIRKGGLGYKLSVWHGDARLFITDRVNDALEDTPQAGQGMGIMLQLGPQWLTTFGNIVLSKQLIEHVWMQFRLFGISEPEQYPARLNRLDIAHDVVGLSVADFSLDDWRKHWVGYAKGKSINESSDLETITIGSYKGAIRFKVYDKVVESNKRATSRFWRSVWGVGADEVVNVARFEWTIKPYGARFTGLRYLNDLTYEGFLDLLNYASLKWGRLCIPQAEDSNKSRWPLAPLWQDMRQLIDDWSFGHPDMATREYDFHPDLKESYLKSVAGWIAGFMARAGIDKDWDTPASLTTALQYLEDRDLSIEDKAEEKHEIYQRLLGRDDLS